MSNYVPLPEYKAWTAYLRAKTGDKGRAILYGDESEKHRVAVYTGRMGDQWIGSTVGLMDLDQSLNSEVEVHTEVLMERRGTDEFLANILSTIAFFAMKDGWKIAPDVIFEKMVSMYVPHTHLPNVMFVPIFRWDDMSKVVVDTKTIFPLLAIPISQAESTLLAQEGADALASRLEERRVDIADWGRDCVAQLRR